MGSPLCLEVNQENRVGGDDDSNCPIVPLSSSCIDIEIITNHMTNEFKERFGGRPKDCNKNTN